LGVTREGDRLCIKPCIPNDWPGYTINYRVGETLHRITITQELNGKNELKLDGIVQPASSFLLSDDAQEHSVEINYCATP